MLFSAKSNFLGCCVSSIFFLLCWFKFSSTTVLASTDLRLFLFRVAGDGSTCSAPDHPLALFFLRLLSDDAYDGVYDVDGAFSAVRFETHPWLMWWWMLMATTRSRLLGWRRSWWCLCWDLKAAEEARMAAVIREDGRESSETSPSEECHSPLLSSDSKTSAAGEVCSAYHPRYLDPGPPRHWIATEAQYLVWRPLDWYLFDESRAPSPRRSCSWYRWRWACPLSEYPASSTQ